MEIDKWIGSYKVRSIPWIDGKRIYFNVQYFAPGQSISKPPVWDKTVYIIDNPAGQRLAYDFTDSLVNHIARIRMEKGRNNIMKVRVTKDEAKYFVQKVEDKAKETIINKYSPLIEGELTKCLENNPDILKAITDL